jgi:hypothetical protein
MSYQCMCYKCQRNGHDIPNRKWGCAMLSRKMWEKEKETENGDRALAPFQWKSEMLDDDDHDNDKDKDKDKVKLVGWG